MVTRCFALKLNFYKKLYSRLHYFKLVQTPVKLRISQITEIVNFDTTRIISISFKVLYISLRYVNGSSYFYGVGKKFLATYFCLLHTFVFISVSSNLSLWKSVVVLKGCVRYIFASLFCKSKGRHSWNKEKCFLYHFKSSFHSWDNQILTFQIFKCYGVIKCPSMKQHTFHWITWEVNTVW